MRRISPRMKNTIVAMLVLASCTVTSLASADNTPVTPVNPDTSTSKADAPMKLSVFASAGYLGTSGGNGAAVGTGVRYTIGEHFAVGLDLGYGLISLGQAMQDRWWIIPSMAVVIPARVGKMPLSFDIGAGFGFGTSSGYASWSTYAARPFSADWAFQLEPAVRAHAIAALSVSHNVDLFVRADAAAMILPQNAAPSDGDAMWMMFALGSRFRLL
jgi:hypothetical protein